MTIELQTIKYTLNNTGNSPNKNKIVKPHRPFTDCKCINHIKRHILNITNIYKRAKLTPKVIIRYYDVDTKQVFRIVDLDPTHPHKLISFHCTCKDWRNDSIKFGVFTSYDHIKKEIKNEKIRQLKENERQLEIQIQKRLQEKRESKLWFRAGNYLCKKVYNVLSVGGSIDGEYYTSMTDNGGTYF